MHDARDLRDLVGDELDQRRQSGFEVGPIEAAAMQAIRGADGPDDPRLLTHLERLEESRRAPAWPFVEIDTAESLLGGLDLMPPARRLAPPADLCGSPTLPGARSGSPADDLFRPASPTVRAQASPIREPLMSVPMA